MTEVPHLPVLRHGRAYESLDKAHLLDHRTAMPLASISQANAGIIRKDLRAVSDARDVLKRFTLAQLLEICTRAADQFLTGTLPLGDKGHTQSAEAYVQT